MSNEVMKTSRAANEREDTKTVVNEDPVVVVLCTAASDAARRVVASLSGTVTDDICLPVGGVDKTSPKASEEKAPKSIDVIAPIASQYVFGDFLKVATHEKKCEVVVLK